jgi:hypothetical protein
MVVATFFCHLCQNFLVLSFGVAKAALAAHWSLVLVILQASCQMGCSGNHGGDAVKCSER